MENLSEFYESEFEEELLKLISNNYNLNKDLIIYFVLRYMLVYKIKNLKKIKIDLFLYFLLEENNLPKKLIYKGVEIDYNTLYSIISNWFFDINKHSESINLITNTYEAILSKSKKNNTKLKRESIYNDSVTFDSLTLLNNQFHVSVDIFNRMNNLIYDINHNDLERFRESKLELNLNAFKEFSSSPFSFISEYDVEKFLKKRLDLIEEGLKIIDTQYKINDGFIDILAEDKNGEKVVIELKIKKDDSRVIWQSLYYPMEIKRIFNTENVRMIIVSPKLNDSLFQVIKTLDNIEYFEYELILKNKKISDLNIKKIL